MILTEFKTVVKVKIRQIDYATVFVVCFAILLGGYVRLVHVLPADFPINDGGLFYTMVLDLKAAHYQLPLFTSYNSAKIPFAYPPLALYITAGISDILNIAEIDLVRLLPGIISTLTIPAFYLLAREILNSTLQIWISVIAFALLPRSFI